MLEISGLERRVRRQLIVGDVHLLDQLLVRGRRFFEGIQLSAVDVFRAERLETGRHLRSSARDGGDG